MIEEETVALASNLIRIDTTNTGDPHTTVGERKAAEYVAGALEEVGLETVYVESGAPGRGNVFARMRGASPGRGALLVHSHLDVVPADPGEWTVHPFSGDVIDDYLWGRGAVDMKNMAAMTLAAARDLARSGTVPPRDLVFAFLADEESGGAQGSRWLVEHDPGLFEGCTEAIGEVGGFSMTLGPARAYMISTAEKGMAWLRLRVTGTAGHGSLPTGDNAIEVLCQAVARLAGHRFPLVLTEPAREFLAGLTSLTGLEFPEDDLDTAVARLGALGHVVGAALRDTATPTMINAGVKANVIPSSAEATVDCRTLPGRFEEFERELAAVLGPHVEREWIERLPSVATGFDCDLVDAMSAAVLSEDPDARLLPYMVSGGTDAKALTRLGIRCYGFTPLRLPPDLNFAALFHGVDERVPVPALHFGARVLRRFLTTC